MPNKKENQVVNEEENLENSKKIDLYINNNDDEEQGISLMNVFATLGKRFHIYIFVMIIGLLAGLLVPTMMYTFKDKTETAVTVLSLDYEKAEDGKAPDGTDLDISYIKSSYIVQNALSNVTLTKEVSTAQVQSNLTITGILTDETKQKIEIINKLEELKNNDYAKLLAELELKYRAQYIISINNIFKDGNNKVILPSTDLSHLLSSIMNAYAEYFIETYQDKVLPANQLDAINIDSLDFLDVLDKVSDFYKYLGEYCKEKSNFLPGFRASNGKSFSDLESILNTENSTRIDAYYSYVYLNNVFRFPEVSITNYKIQQRDAQLKLSSVEADIAATETSIANYKPDKVVVNNQDGTTPLVVEVTSDYYNQLVLNLQDLYAEKSSLEERISILTDRIARLGDPTQLGGQDKVNKATGYVNEALEYAQKLFNLVNDTSKELYASNAYRNKYMHSVTTRTSEKFSDSLKMFGIGAAVGLGLGLLAWILDAFVLEFKAVKKANELKEDK